MWRLVWIKYTSSIKVMVMKWYIVRCNKHFIFMSHRLLQIKTDRCTRTGKCNLIKCISDYKLEFNFEQFSTW
jgi:hypothetical protein